MIQDKVVERIDVAKIGDQKHIKRYTEYSMIHEKYNEFGKIDSINEYDIVNGENKLCKVTDYKYNMNMDLEYILVILTEGGALRTEERTYSKDDDRKLIRVVKIPETVLSTKKKSKNTKIVEEYEYIGDEIAKVYLYVDDEHVDTIQYDRSTPNCIVKKHILSGNIEVDVDSTFVDSDGNKIRIHKTDNYIYETGETISEIFEYMNGMLSDYTKAINCIAQHRVTYYTDSLCSGIKKTEKIYTDYEDISEAFRYDKCDYIKESDTYEKVTINKYDLIHKF